MGQKNAAVESHAVKRARKKLEKQFEEERKSFTPEALQGVMEKMKMWINRHASERVSLKDKAIRLFDENQSVADITGPIANLREQIKHDMQVTAEAPVKGLRGRITLDQTQQELPSFDLPEGEDPNE